MSKRAKLIWHGSERVGISKVEMFQVASAWYAMEEDKAAGRGTMGGEGDGYVGVEGKRRGMLCGMCGL